MKNQKNNNSNTMGNKKQTYILFIISNTSTSTTSRPVGKAGERAESLHLRLNYDVLPADFLVLFSKPLTGNRPRNR